MASNTNNTGIYHAAFRDGGPALCRRNNAIMSMSIERFRLIGGNGCKRCAAKLAKMGERQAARKDGEQAA